jgi:hypothetical protein
MVFVRRTGERHRKRELRVCTTLASDCVERRFANALTPRLLRLASGLVVTQ